eukprot:3604577-Rhodomonas_salina.11
MALLSGYTPLKEESIAAHVMKLSAVKAGTAAPLPPTPALRYLPTPAGTDVRVCWYRSARR